MGQTQNCPACSPRSAPGTSEELPLSFNPPHQKQSNSVTVLTWNVAAVNNNPFEYWIQYDDPMYMHLMLEVEKFLQNPGERDVEIRSVFTDEMYAELEERMQEKGISGLEKVKSSFWNGGELALSSRTIVGGFIKDKTLGEKRLISMPDRCTNTVQIVTRKETGYRPPPVCRPCVINNYEGDLSGKDVWWETWKEFMFETRLTTRTKKGVEVQLPCEMVEPMIRKKYPALTEQEEEVCVPLQILCLAIFDTILVHMMNTVSPEGNWQIIKSKICNRLYRGKHDRTVEILVDHYAAVDIMCIQECAAIFQDRFRGSRLAETHELVTPNSMDGKRDQNSFVLVRKATFEANTVREVTEEMPSLSRRQGSMNMDPPLVAPGDVIVVEMTNIATQKKFLVMSFHGDTSGKLTRPQVQAMHEMKTGQTRDKFSDHTYILGLDANVYEKASGDKIAFTDFVEDYLGMGFTSCFGDSPDVTSCKTTCSARTFLQPQLNKAVRYEDRVAKSDCNPKDTILFYKDQLKICNASDMLTSNPVKDNTGKLRFNENSIFPTLDFPSDHGIIAVALSHV